MRHGRDGRRRAAAPSWTGPGRKAQEDRALATDIPPTARVLAVSSGKGGVGKSSVTVNLAVALARRGLVVGLLDADIWGFSVPRLLGMRGELRAEAQARSSPSRSRSAPGLLKVVSMGFLADEDTAIMWRGLILNRAVQQFLEDVRWGDARLPPHRHAARAPATSRWAWPGCCRAPRSLVVTTPPMAAQKVAARAADMARKGHLRVAGVIENMSPFTCEHGTDLRPVRRRAAAPAWPPRSASRSIGVGPAPPRHGRRRRRRRRRWPHRRRPLAAAFDALATRIAEDDRPGGGDVGLHGPAPRHASKPPSATPDERPIGAGRRQADPRRPPRRLDVVGVVAARPGRRRPACAGAPTATSGPRGAASSVHVGVDGGHQLVDRGAPARLPAPRPRRARAPGGGR